MTGNEIPAVFWMVIISVVTAFVCFILYYVAIVMKQTAGTIGETKEVVKSSNKLIAESTEIVTDLKDSAKMLKGAMQDVSESIIPPIKKIGTFLNTVTSLLDGVTGFFKKD